mgnify:CR=1 FL=1
MGRSPEMWAYKPLRTKCFHGVSSGNQHPYLLKSRYGKVSRIAFLRAAGCFAGEPASHRSTAYSGMGSLEWAVAVYPRLRVRVPTRRIVSSPARCSAGRRSLHCRNTRSSHCVNSADFWSRAPASCSASDQNQPAGDSCSGRKGTGAAGGGSISCR